MRQYDVKVSKKIIPFSKYPTVDSVAMGFRTWIMNFLDNDPSENRMKFTKLKVTCKYASIGRGCACYWFSAYCKILLRKKNYFSPWDFFFRTALSGLRSEISIESKWVCNHIKLSSYFNHRVTNAKTQFDMAVKPLWFNINLKTAAKTWREHCGSSLPECTFLWVLFSMNNIDKTTADQGTGPMPGCTLVMIKKSTCTISLNYS